MLQDNAPMARNALRILCQHFGYEPNYEQVQELYIDLCQQIAEHRAEGGQHTVESLLLQIITNELGEQLTLWVDDVETP